MENDDCRGPEDERNGRLLFSGQFGSLVWGHEDVLKMGGGDGTIM